MRLKKLIVYGFKSFAARTEIVFNEGITGIVGPNGSGKSNIGDAVRWVLGEQSPKTLRGASMSDVIFNGTQKRKPHSYCEVSLVFDNEDHALALDFAEVMVTRRVYRNGDSEYFLNQASCRLKDIVDLFRDTGIGKEGYSIIGQGRIDEILSRRSEDRRLIFEEAAGIVKYKARKEEADKKLARTLDNAARVDDILEELTRQLGPLEQQSKAARDYIELSGELKIIDLNLFLIKSDKAKARLDELSAELEGLRAVLFNTEAALTEKTAKRNKYQENIAQLDERIGTARSLLMSCAEAAHQTESSLSAAKSRQVTRCDNMRRVIDEQSEGEKRLQELDKLWENGATQMDKQEELVAAAQKQLEIAKEAADVAAKAENAAALELENHKNELVAAMNRLSAVRNDQTRLKTMRSQMADRLNEIRQSSDQLTDEENRLQEAVSQASQRLQHEKVLGDQLEETHQTHQMALQKMDAALSALRAETEQLSSSLQGTQSRYRLLTEMTREMEGYNQSVRRAVQFGKDQHMSGVKGVLAQLIQVPAKYETAIDMALGAAQQNIITDTEETAKSIIDYLRKNRLGRATFLPMSSVKSKSLYEREKQVLTMPGCLGVASDLITCAPEYRGVIENLLGRTVIADNLEHGIPIMRAGNHAFRLVTLEGDVMHSGGSMSGGSAQSKMVNLLSREREVKEMANALRIGKEKLDGLKLRLQETQESKNQLKTTVADALYAVHQQEIAIVRENERVTNAKGELEAHRNRIGQTQQATQQLEESIASIDHQLNAITQTGDTVQLDQEAMEEKTQQLQSLLSSAKQTLSDANDRVMTRTLQLSDLRHSLDVMQHDADRYEQDRDQLMQDREKREELLKEMRTSDEEDSILIASLTIALENQQEQQRQQEQAAIALEKQRTQLQEALRQVLSDTESLHQAYTRDSESVHRADLAFSKVDGDLHTLQDRIWNTYELTYAGAQEFRVDEEAFDFAKSERRAAFLSAKIRALGNVNVNAVEEYAEAKARFDELTAQQNDLKAAEKDLRELIDRLLEQMEVTFVDNFSKMQGYFSETFTRLFGGGHAELALLDPNDPLNCGIEVNAQPPGKKLQLLSLLSGGERALTAIAILFAMLKLKPTPFCILDEIEAALDDANIGYYADYLKEYSQSTQFIVVTHRKGTMERCDSLYGVAMEEQGVSKMVSVSLQDYQE